MRAPDRILKRRPREYLSKSLGGIRTCAACEADVWPDSCCNASVSELTTTPRDFYNGSMGLHFEQ